MFNNLNSLDIDFSSKRAFLREHPLLRKIPEDGSTRYLASLQPERFAAVAYKLRGRLPFMQPRGGFGIWKQQRELSIALDKAGADFIPLTIDSHTRQNDYERASLLLRQSEQKDENLLNGYPLLAHGAEATRLLYEGINRPVSLRHGTPDARLLVEAALDSGITEIEGGGLCYSLPYSRSYPVDRALLNWQYIDRLCAVLSTEDRPIHRESFGALTATMVPPFMVVAIEVLELLLAAEQGVKSFAVSFAQTGSLTQDLATAKALRAVASHQLSKFGIRNTVTRMVLHQWMGAFPQERIRADALIVQGAIIASLSNVDKVVVKTRTEALGIPDPQSNSDAVIMTRYAMEICQGSLHLTNSTVEEEYEAIESAANYLIDAVINIDNGPLWNCIARAVRRGFIDIPFSPHQENCDKLWALRDNNRNIRVADIGLVPVPISFLEREKKLLARRIFDHSLDGMIDDVLLMTKRSDQIKFKN